MNIRLILNTLLVRQRGYTSAIRQGIDNYDSPVYVVAHSLSYAKELCKSNKYAIPVSFVNLYNLQGTVHPVIFDNSALIQIALEALDEIGVLEKEVNLERKEKEKLETEIKNLKSSLTLAIRINEHLQDYIKDMPLPWTRRIRIKFYEIMDRIKYRC